MPTLTDLCGDWFLCRVSLTRDDATLTLIQLETDAEACKQITIAGLDAILALRDAIDTEVQLADQRADLENGD